MYEKIRHYTKLIYNKKEIMNTSFEIINKSTALQFILYNISSPHKIWNECIIDIRYVNGHGLNLLHKQMQIKSQNLGLQSSLTSACGADLFSRECK